MATSRHPTFKSKLTHTQCTLFTHILITTVVVLHQTCYAEILDTPAPKQAGNVDINQQKPDTDLEVPDYPEEGEWDREVYTARHFDDLVLSSTAVSDIVQHPAMLVLHTPECNNEDNFSSLPPQVHMYYIKHDWETSPLHIPYSLEGVHSLYERYQPQNCPTILYFPVGRSVFHPDVFQSNEDTHLSPVDWIWNKMLIHVTIKNDVPGTISVVMTGPGPAFDRMVLHQGDTLDIQVYVSYLVTITQYIGEDLAPKFLLGQEFTLSDNNTEITVNDHMTTGYNSESDWLLQKQDDIWKSEDRILQRQFNMAEIYLMNFKQAILLPKFTTLGYEHREMPPGLQEALSKYYEHGLSEREEEQGTLDPLINDKEVKCTMVPLGDDIRELIFSVLGPIAEQWCGKALRPTAAYGIREYHHGNVLRHHVDRPATHVISIQLPVYIKNSNSESDWPFELINHNGQEVMLNLSMGEMLMYESASVIHGRTKPFQGDIYASAYVHFQPEYDWLWSEQIMGKRQKRFLVNGLNYEFVEPLYVFATESTKRKHIKFTDEL